MSNLARAASLLLLGCLGSCVLTWNEADRERTHLPAEGALGPYSGSVRARGFCFVSGKIGQRGGSFREEVETAIDAVEKELARSGLGLADVVSSTVFLVDMGLYAELNEIYAARFPPPYPARACIAVRELPAGARVEIQVVACHEG